MKTKLLLILSLSLSFQGCMFYSLKGSLPAHINSISLAPVNNESAEFAAAEVLNEELNELMIHENVLDIVLPEDADSRLEITINSVTDIPYTVNISSELGMEEVEEWKITIKTSVVWHDLKRDEVLFQRKMQSWGAYTPGVDISTDGLDNDGDNLIDGEDSDEIGSPREGALNISVRRLTEDIVNEITNTW
ncbi:MAG: LPS assembly lipoprotein LptE [Candidatus Marinimicrobia bacterium]|nr:LPS assembly lipoprotein LptE [Candidatus Neomarinimicrobiota bacterium]MDP6852756.1 LPS assembly lipoprotein LptE [Candidatus Neomarinimicrobiota bacterium]MDP6936190.1 LPS assembly lipoprotein LptE [Candidatus Neomarinimicrobiota bacterium]